MAKPRERIESHTDDPYYIFNPPREDMRKADRNASLTDLMRYIYQSLIDYQGKWESTWLEGWVIKMPNARYLSVGDSIRNITTGDTYTITEIVDRMYNVIRISGKDQPESGDRLELDDKNIVNFVSDYSQEYKDKPYNTWVDTVSYRINRKEPGTIGKHPFDPPSEIKPRVREYLVDPEYPDLHICVLGQWFDNLVQFDCWAKTNNRADDLIEWFEDFMYKYIWVWKRNGVNEILYWMRKQDEQIRKWRNDLHTRTVLYYIKTEKIVVIREYDLKQVDLYLEVSNVLPSGFYGVGYGAIPPSGKTEVIDGNFQYYF